MIDPLVAGAAFLAAVWLLVILYAPRLAKMRAPECEAVGITADDYAHALRTRVSINLLTVLCLGVLGVVIATRMGVDPYLGAMAGFALSVPVAFALFALANATVAPGFNDVFLRVRATIRERKKRGASR